MCKLLFSFTGCLQCQAAAEPRHLVVFSHGFALKIGHFPFAYTFVILVITHPHINKQARKHASKQTNKPAIKQASKQTSILYNVYIGVRVLVGVLGLKLWMPAQIEKCTKFF